MTARARRAAAPKSPARQEVELALAVLALIAATCALGLVGLAAAARPLYLSGAVGVAWFAMRRSPWLYLSATLWFWLLTAFVRRVIEWHSGFQPTDLILGTPNLVALLMVAPVMTAPGLLARRGLGPGLIVTVSMVYGLCVSFLRGDILAAAVAAADWLTPLLYFFYVVAQGDRADSLQPHLRTFMLLALGVTVPYGLVQYFFLPEWDSAWMINSEMTAVGLPFPLEVRVFGTTNHPGFLAIWLGFGVLLAPFLRSKTLVALVPAAVFLLVLTLVRSVYGSVALALAASVLLGRGQQVLKPLATVALALLALTASLAAVSPVVAEKIVARFETMQHLDEDSSAQTRRLIYQQTPNIIDKYPLGLGLGALGRGAVASGTNYDLVNVDSGPLAAYLALGWVGGSAYMVGLLLAAVQSLAAARRHRSPLVLAFACAALCPLGTFPFINVINFDGVVMWICFGFTAVLGARAAVDRGSAGRPRGAGRGGGLIQTGSAAP